VICDEMREGRALAVTHTSIPLAVGAMCRVLPGRSPAALNRPISSASA